ncbi:hypothetical protein ACIA99_11465 [Amycolatopsis magusensis]|uniref:hypothetical protein n=1 Tax=Amycolatopsis magusensis TaxID=882444 RepID=UPI0037B92611
MKLYLVCAGEGMPTMWRLADPKLGEREVFAALPRHSHHLIRPRQILLATKVSRAITFPPTNHRDGPTAESPPPRRRPQQRAPADRVGQPDLKGQLDLEQRGARNPSRGIRARRATSAAHGRRDLARLETGVASKRSLTSFDH